MATERVNYLDGKSIFDEHLRDLNVSENTGRLLFELKMEAKYPTLGYALNTEYVKLRSLVGEDLFSRRYQTLLEQRPSSQEFAKGVLASIEKIGEEDFLQIRALLILSDLMMKVHFPQCRQSSQYLEDLVVNRTVKVNFGNLEGGNLLFSLVTINQAVNELGEDKSRQIFDSFREAAKGARLIV